MKIRKYLSEESSGLSALHLQTVISDLCHGTNDFNGLQKVFVHVVVTKCLFTLHSVQSPYLPAPTKTHLHHRHYIFINFTKILSLCSKIYCKYHKIFLSVAYFPVNGEKVP